jgi:hypothetical protein
MNEKGQWHIVHCYLNCVRIGELKIVFNSPIPPLTKLVPKWVRKGLLESETENIFVSLPARKSLQRFL